MSKDTKATATATTATTTAKVSAKVVDLVTELIDVRAEITRLTKIKDELTETINEIFDESNADTLTHRNLEVARRITKMREGTDEKALAEMFPEVHAQTRKVTIFTQINTLWKKN
jgi:hypothetical protein